MPHIDVAREQGPTHNRLVDIKSLEFVQAPLASVEPRLSRGTTFLLQRAWLREGHAEAAFRDRISKGNVKPVVAGDLC